MEIEIKLAVDDAEAAARILEEGGAEAKVPRTFEDNRLFDLPGRPLTAEGRLLRVREYAGRVIVTAKAPVGAGGAATEAAAADGETRYKIRREAEIIVPDAEAMVAVLRTAGFEPLWRYQKYRRIYAWKGAEVVLDETPAGAFLEIEGDPAAIDRIVARLGGHAGERLTDTYREVWEAHCAERGIPVGDMLFATGAAEATGAAGAGADPRGQAEGAR